MQHRAGITQRLTVRELHSQPGHGGLSLGPPCQVLDRVVSVRVAVSHEESLWCTQRMLAAVSGSLGVAQIPPERCEFVWALRDLHRGGCHTI